jgi:peptidoglycan/LPS O-acetylase OafA/YrhL
MVSSSPRADHYGFLDALRGLAALWVVFNHLALPLAGDDLPSPLRVWLIEYGGLGVQVFFAISGFVIAHSLRKVGMDNGEFRNFAARRFARISPPYYAALILALVVSFTSAQFKDEPWALPSPGRFLAHLVYVPDLFNMQMINGVHWTLFLEVQFYLLFALVLWLIARLAGRWRLADQVVMAAVGAVALLYPLFDLRNAREHYFLPYCFAFVLGVFVQWYVTGRLRREIFCTYLALLGVAWVAHGDSLVGAAFVTGLIILASTVGDRSQRWLRQRPFRFLGKISYSLYLTHAPVIGAVFYLGTKAFGDTKTVETALILPLVIASLITGAVAWKLFEEPAVRWSRSLRRRPTPPAPRVATT